MSLVLALLGLGISVALVIRNARGDRVSQLVFLFSAVHVLYVFPKVLALSVSSAPSAEYFRMNGVTSTVAYMALSSYLATIIAYELLAPKSGVAYGIENMKAFMKRMSRFAITIGGLGLLAFLGLMARNGGLNNYFLGLAYYQMDLSGMTVWLIFLSRFTYPAIAAMALVAALRPSRFSLTVLTLLCVFPLMNVIFLFRRSDLLFLGFIAIHALTLSGRIRANRAFVLASIGVMSLLIVLFPYFRQESISAVTGWDYNIAEMTVQERVTDSLEVDADDEIVRAASTIDYAYQTGNFQYGAFVWDSLVNQFVPATLVGAEAKNALFLGRGMDSNTVQSYFDQQSFFYVAPMGFAQAYEQFGPFGWIIFAALGALIAGVERKSWKVSNRIFLMVAIPIVSLAASNDISSVPARLVTFWVLSRFLGSARFLVYSPRVRQSYGLAKIFTHREMRELRG